MTKWEILRGEQKSLAYHGQPVHSVKNPEKEGERFAKSFLAKRPTTHWNFFLGIGLGYHVKAFYDILQSRNASPIHMICVFLDAEEKRLFKEQWTGILPLNTKEWVLLELHDTHVLQNVLRELARSAWRQHIAVVEYSPVTRFVKERYDKFTKQLQEWLSYEIQNLSTTEYFVSSWAKNFLYNLPYFFSPTSLKLSGDVILVSAGPSLRENLSFLKEHKGIVPIACVDTALSTLRDADIMPDIVVSCDAQVDNYYDFFCVLSDKEIFRREKTILVGNMVQYHGIPPLFSHHVLFPSEGILEDWTPIFLGSHRPMLPSGGSVASFALSALRELGAKRFLLVGQDLENSPLTHAVSSPQYKRKIFGNGNRLYPFYNHMIPWLRYPEIPARTPMLENLAHWIRDFFTFYSVLGLHKNPVRSIGVPPYKGESLKGTMQMENTDIEGWELSKELAQKTFSPTNGIKWIKERENLGETERKVLGDLFSRQEQTWKKSQNRKRYEQDVRKTLMQANKKLLHEC